MKRDKKLMGYGCREGVYYCPACMSAAQAASAEDDFVPIYTSDEDYEELRCDHCNQRLGVAK